MTGRDKGINANVLDHYPEIRDSMYMYMYMYIYIYIYIYIKRERERERERGRGRGRGRGSVCVWGPEGECRIVKNDFLFDDEP